MIRTVENKETRFECLVFFYPKITMNEKNREWF